MNNASAEKIMAVIDTCPSGALSYKRKEKIND
ncbi:(4Fe-4S)-binding protein [Helcococcus kunzii]